MLRAADKAASEIELYTFMRKAWHVCEPETPFVDGWHLGAIADHLQAVATGEFRRLIINMPPRCMKSLTVSVFWHAWVWIFWPASRWLFSSYAGNLSIRDSLKARDVILSPWFQERWGDRFELRYDQNKKSRFENNYKGFRQATSVGAQMATGEGGDFIVVDDPISIDDAESPAVRLACNNWWDRTMSTRGNDPKTARWVIVMQRTNEDDLTGHILAEQLGYEHLMLPMRYEPARSCVTSLGFKDPRTQEHELLWKERFGEPEVVHLERTLGAYGTAGQLQQRPAPAGGVLLKRENFGYFRVEPVSIDAIRTMAAQINEARLDGLTPAKVGLPRIPSDPERIRDGLRFAVVLLDRTGQGRERRFFAWTCWWFQTVDTAMKTGQENDYTAIGTFAVTPENDLLIYEMFRDKIEVPKQYGVILGYREAYPWIEAQYVEDTASGTGLIQQAKTGGAAVRGFRVDRDKKRNASNLATMYQNAAVYHRSAAGWLGTWEDEATMFPAAAHDDQVDCAANAANIILERAMKEPRVRGL